MLSKAINLLLQKSITKEDIIEAHKLLLNYVYLFNKYFGDTSMVLNVHLLTHIVQGVLNWGPLWTHNAFIYEGQNRHLLQLLQSPGQLLKQIARKFLIFSDLPTLCNELGSTQSTITFCENVLQNKLQHFITCEGIILLGKRETCKFLSEEYNCIKEYNFHLSECTSFKRLLYNNIRYSIEDYSLNKKHNDSYILTRYQMFAVIKKIIYVSDIKVYLLVQEVFVEKKPLLSHEDFKYIHIKQLVGYGKFFCIQCFEIEAQCMFINIINNKYLCKMPFSCRGD